MLGTAEPQEQALFARVVDIIQAARQRVARSVNIAMVQAYWLIGHDIVELEQHGEVRAGYGDELISRLAKHLRSQVGRGFGPRISCAEFGNSTWYTRRARPCQSPARFGQHR